MSELHPVAWLLWASAAGVTALLARNPLYLMLIILVSGIVLAGQRRAAHAALFSRGGLVRFALLAVILSLVLNMLFSHSGRTVLLRLPPEVPYIGGPITLEAALYGLTTGLTIVALLLIMMAFNAAVEPMQLLRYLPSALYSAGLVLSIALTFAPQTKRALDEIREAQQVRGHRPRGLRDLPPLVVPLITTGLENAMGLAEAMAARGFGRTTNGSNSALFTGGLALASLGLLVGLAAYGFRPVLAPVALGLVIVSAAALIGLLWQSGRNVSRSRYRDRRWRLPDALVAAQSAALLAGVLALYFTDAAMLSYNPYPQAALPPFSPLIGAALLVLAAPALVEARAVARRSTAR
jgi:energy-coupling factor transport system permease protein